MNLAIELPRLLYIGDVPVESSYHGSALLYRLLQDYTPERSRIVETNVIGSMPERRLRGVTYVEPRLGHPRPFRTRFAPGLFLMAIVHHRTQSTTDCTPGVYYVATAYASPCLPRDVCGIYSSVLHNGMRTCIFHGTSR